MAFNLRTKRHRLHWTIAVGVAAGCLWAAGTVEAGGFPDTRFRINSLVLRDPHAFTFVGICLDVTSESINTPTANLIAGDGNLDGFLDLSYVLAFQPLDRTAPTNAFAFGSAVCTFGGTNCGPIVDPQASTVTLMETGTCLQPVVGTLRPYNPGVTSAVAPCFSTPNQPLILVLAGIEIPLIDARIAAQFVGAPGTTGLANGLIRGFLTETDADNTFIPGAIPIIGGQRLSLVLPGGSGNCRSGANSDQDNNSGQDGWWIYVNFSATPLNDPLPNLVFQSGFEDT